MEPFPGTRTAPYRGATRQPRARRATPVRSGDSDDPTARSASRLGRPRRCWPAQLAAARPSTRLADAGRAAPAPPAGPSAVRAVLGSTGGPAAGGRTLLRHATQAVPQGPVVGDRVAG